MHRCASSHLDSITFNYLAQDQIILAKQFISSQNCEDIPNMPTSNSMCLAGCLMLAVFAQAASPQAASPSAGPASGPAALPHPTETMVGLGFPDRKRVVSGK